MMDQNIASNTWILETDSDVNSFNGQFQHKIEGGQKNPKNKKTKFPYLDFSVEEKPDDGLVGVQVVDQANTLSEQLLIDPLTRLFNRRKFLHINKLLKKIATEDGKNEYDKSKLNNLFAIIQIDLNFFKQINDTYGHKIGDRILIQTARFFVENFRRENDIIIRTGGDEFVIVVFNDDQMNTNFTQSVVDYTSNVSQNCPKFPFSIPDKGLESTYQLSFAYGIASFDSNLDTNFDDTLHRADLAMYKHKTEMKAVTKRKKRKSMEPRASITAANRNAILGT